MSAPHITRYHDIARLTSTISADHFHAHYVATNTPVILPMESAVSSSDWSVSRLQSLLGPLAMSNVFRAADGRYTFFDPKRQASGTQTDRLQRQRMTFDEFVHRAGQHNQTEETKEDEETHERTEGDTSETELRSRYYLYGEPLPAPLRSLLPPPTILAPIPSLSSSLLWVAVDGSLSPLHYDLSDGVLCQLQHSKHFLLFAPHHYHALAPYPTDHIHDRQSQLHFDTARLTPQRPTDGDEGLQGGLEGWVGEVHAGEMTYLPYGWWHQVESDGECVSVTYRWDASQQQLQQIRAVSTQNTRPSECAAVSGVCANVQRALCVLLMCTCMRQCERSVSSLPAAASVRILSSLLSTLPEHVSRYYMRRSRWKDEFVRQQLLQDDEVMPASATLHTG